MSFPVTFEFAFNQDVRIKALGINGVVVAQCEKQGCHRTYEVIYWADAKRNDEWLEEFELEAVKSNGAKREVERPNTDLLHEMHNK